MADANAVKRVRKLHCTSIAYEACHPQRCSFKPLCPDPSEKRTDKWPSPAELCIRNAAWLDVNIVQRIVRHTTDGAAYGIQVDCVH